MLSTMQGICSFRLDGDTKYFAIPFCVLFFLLCTVSYLQSFFVCFILCVLYLQSRLCFILSCILSGFFFASRRPRDCSSCGVYGQLFNTPDRSERSRSRSCRADQIYHDLDHLDITCRTGMLYRLCIVQIQLRKLVTKSGRLHGSHPVAT